MKTLCGVLFLAVVLPALAAMASKPPTELVQSECGSMQPNAFYIDLVDPDDPSGQNSGPFILTFDPKGPGIYLPGFPYSPGWSDVQQIVFVYASDGEHGHLSLNMRQHGRSFVQRVGLIKRDCWQLAKAYLSDNRIDVPISESRWDRDGK